jgi:hypothetical protein
MNSYSQCEAQAKLIGQQFHNLLGGDGEQKNFFLEYPDLETLNIKAPILVLGLNPSGEDDPLLGRSVPNLFSYIPQNPSITKESSGNEQKDLQKFCYSPYFKTFIECFQLLNPNYNPLWYNRVILNNIYQSNSEHLTKELIEYLTNYSTQDYGNYVVFADMIQYSKTNSKSIVEHLDKPNVKIMINSYIELMFNFIQPKLVLSANASVSHYLVNNFNEGKLNTHFSMFNTEVFLGSMLTGQRAMDVFSRQRLFKEIQDFLNKKN